MQFPTFQLVLRCLLWTRPLSFLLSKRHSDVFDIHIAPSPMHLAALQPLIKLPPHCLCCFEKVARSLGSDMMMDSSRGGSQHTFFIKSLFPLALMDIMETFEGRGARKSGNSCALYRWVRMQRVPVGGLNSSFRSRR